MLTSDVFAEICCLSVEVDVQTKMMIKGGRRLRKRRAGVGATLFDSDINHIWSKNPDLGHVCFQCERSVCFGWLDLFIFCRNV